MIIMSLDDRSGRINHDSATPVPVQVAADIERDIDAGRLAPDTRLPSEMELSAQYGVARVSVRRAMELLRERRKVVTVHGRGTFVAPQPEHLPFRAVTRVELRPAVNQSRGRDVALGSVKSGGTGSTGERPRETAARQWQ
jgi:DNA-binding GntR family transcriptional regulator